MPPNDPQPERVGRSSASHRLTVGDGQLVVEESGDPADTAVVVLHGLMGSMREWDGMVAALAPTFRVIALDQRGHGESDWAPEYSAAAFAEDVVSVMDDRQVARAHLVGHSMGGMAAALVAARHPGRVGRVVIMDIGPDSLSSAFAELLPATLESMASASYADVDEAMAEWAAQNPHAQEEHLRHYLDHVLVPRADGRLRYRFDARGLIRFVTDGVTESQLWTAIDQITAPTLVVRGAQSEVLSRGTALQLVERLEDAELVEIAGGGHDLGVEQPEATAAAALAFLERA
jgi:pimeloyl-ACP methyl ester carboxylesterase